MNLSSLHPGQLKTLLLAAAVLVEATGLVLMISGFKLRNPRNPPRITWRILEWKPITRQRDHFLGRGFGLYQSGIRLFILGAAAHLASILIRR